MKKLFSLAQLVGSILIASTLLFFLVRATIERLDVFYSICFGIMFLLGLALVALSWNELKEANK